MSKHAVGGCTAALLMLGLLTACRHKAPPPPAPAATAPPLTASNITVITPLPSVPAQAKPDVQPAPKEQPAPPAPAQPVQRVRRLHHKRSAPPTPAPVETTPASTAGGTSPAAAPAPANATPATNPTAAANPPTPGTEAASPTVAQAAAPALGQLSAGTVINTAERNRMIGEVQQQEARLLKLKPAKSSEALALQTQVRTFLNKARQAVTENDLDGAQTLNTKARVLLDELQSE